MKTLSYLIAANTATYVPAPVRGTVAKVTATWQTTVTTSNIVTVARAGTAVNVVTAVTTAGQVVETGVADTTNGQLVFDPASSTAANGVITITPSGGNAVAVVVNIFFDESAYVTQAAKEA